MTNSIHRAGAAYVIPGIPYQPARPAFTTYETINVFVRQVPVPGGGTRTIYIDVSTGRVVDVPVGTPIGFVELAGFYYVTLPVYHPAVPEVQGTPSQRIESPPVGWTSFARSIAQIAGPGGIAGFKVPASVTGVAIGLSARPAPPAGYSHINHGLLFTGGVARSLRTGTNFGAYTDSDSFAVAVRSGVVSFKKGGVDLGTEPSTYAVGEPLHMAAVLYRLGDSVDEPSLVGDEGGTSTAKLPALRAFTSETEHAESVATFPALQVRSGVLSRSAAVLPGLAAFSSDRLGGSSRAELAPLRADSYGGTLVVVPKSVSVAGLPPLAAASLLLVGETGSSSAQLPGMLAISADRPYGTSRAPLPGLSAVSYTGPHDLVNVFVPFALKISLDAIKVDVVDVRETFSFDVPMTADSVDLVRMEMAFSLDVLMSAGVVEIVDIRDSFALDVELSTPGADLEVHAVNMDGFGSTTYSGYPFNSFARIGDRYYGAALGGLFLLEGDTDAGAPIQAAICPGKLDFGNSQQKTVSEVFIGATSESALVLKVSGPAGSFEYEAKGYSEELQQHRFKLGKGLKTNYLIPVFYNQDGADFEIDSLEFTVADLSRKTRP